MASLGTVMRVVIVGALLLAAAPAPAQDDDSPVARGRHLFETRGCYGCHAIGGVGATTAPSLSRVGRSTPASIWRAGSGRRRRAARWSTCRGSRWPSPSWRR